MKKLLNSRVIRYLLYFCGLSIMKYFCGFESTVLWIGAYILVDMEYINKNDNHD